MNIVHATKCGLSTDIFWSKQILNAPPNRKSAFCWLLSASSEFYVTIVRNFLICTRAYSWRWITVPLVGLPIAVSCILRLPVTGLGIVLVVIQLLTWPLSWQWLLSYTNSWLRLLVSAVDCTVTSFVNFWPVLSIFDQFCQSCLDIWIAYLIARLPVVFLRTWKLDTYKAESKHCYKSRKSENWLNSQLLLTFVGVDSRLLFVSIFVS